MPFDLVRRRRLARKPQVEAVEERLLMSAAPLPDIAMTSATALDSRSVTIEYDVRGSAPTGPVEIGIYRSADNQLDATSIPVATETIVAPDTALGHHRVTFDLADGLPINPSHPYVLVVADPKNLVGESDETNNVASFRKHVIGVVTHGGVQPKKWVNGPAWEHRMALGLQADGYDAVIPYNWVAQSNHPGSAAWQSRRLATMVEDAAAQFPASDPVDVHFIGHSEGTVINSRTIIRMQDSASPALNAGYLKVTMLDPHAANNGVKGQQYSVSNDLFGWFARQRINDFQSRAQDAAIVVPPRVNDAEVYYQHTPISLAKDSNGGIYNLWGQVPVHGSAKYSNLTGPGISHGGKFAVYDWYQINVVPTLSGDGSRFINPGLLTGGPDLGVNGGLVGGLPVSTVPRPHFDGKAAPGATIRLFAATRGSTNITVIGKTVADSNGQWSLDTRPMSDGRYKVIALSMVAADPARPFRHVTPSASFGRLDIDTKGNELR